MISQFNHRQICVLLGFTLFYPSPPHARTRTLNHKNYLEVSDAGSAVAAGVMDMKPADPIEGVLISQIVVANEVALSLYQRAWTCSPADYFEAHTKYLQLADKATRTVAMLTERL